MASKVVPTHGIAGSWSDELVYDKAEYRKILAGAGASHSASFEAQRAQTVDS